MAFTAARVTPRSKLHVEKAKYEQQKVYNKRRKERPLKPRSSLNIQFNFGKKEMTVEQERLVGFCKATSLKSGHTNTDFLLEVMDSFRG